MGTFKVSSIFENCQFVADFAGSLSLTFKGKQEIRQKIVENGGVLSHVLSKKTNFLVTGDSEQTLSSCKGRTAVKLGIPVVPFDFITECIKSGKLVDPHPFALSETIESQNFSSGRIVAKSERKDNATKATKKRKLPDLKRIKVWSYKAVDGPEFDEPNCEIVKDAVLVKTNPGKGSLSLFSVELHFMPSHVPSNSSRYRLFTHQGTLEGFIMGNDEGTKECRYFNSSEEAFGAFIALIDQQYSNGYKKLSKYPSPKIGSDRLKQLAKDELFSQEDSTISPEVANLINYIWNEAVGSLVDILAIPLSSIKLEDVEKAEAILLLLRKSLDGDEELSTIPQLSDEFFSAIPHKNRGENITSKRLIAQKQDLCQLIKDMVSIGESTNWKTRQDVHSKYRALKSFIECLNHDSDEFKKIQTLVKSSETSPPEIDVLNVYSIHRPVEESAFSPHIGNNSLLFHASKVANFVGILSRGLLMPKIVVDDFGGQRADPGMLGSGIYFANSASTSAKYSAPGSKGSRLMLVNEVALGKVKEFKTYAMDLISPPPGYSSCHGMKSTDDEPSDFKDDEFAIYNGNQQKIRYLVEFVLPGDVEVPDRDDVSIDSGFFDDSSETATKDHHGSVDLTDVLSVVDPLTKVEAGLKGTGDKPIPLQSVHIRAKLIDMAAQVIVFQRYNNNSSTPIEAKYVFPLDDMAAVCGFEAFINDKHIVGEVKEKEQAHKEYREAISKGHGAYLMDEETPDVFTVSVGNLPPGAQVLIKITYVTELTVDGEQISFSLPGSVAPWTRDKALEEVTQTDVDTVRIGDVGPSDPAFDVSVKASVEMPFEIRSLDSPTHAMKTKRTATKAVIELEPGQSLGDGFQLLVGLAEIHVPRMWVERHISDSDSQACMLTFYPEFEAESPSEVEVIFLLDLSCSMKGSNLNDAKKILLMCLSLMKEGWIFNVLVFGSKHSELFLYSIKKNEDSFEEAKKFVESLTADKGSTELWRVLQKLYMLPTLSTADHPRTLFLISDGHVTEEETTLGLIRSHRQSDRLFTFGVGSTANRYLLRAMSKVGAGASEFFDGSAKSKWERKVKSQLSKAEQPGLTSMRVTWQQHDSGSSPPVQAPHQLLSLFNGSRQVVYGFVNNCTQATLTAEVNGTTVSTMVSTADLNITTGKILHQLTARAVIRDWDEGSLHEQRSGHEIVKRDRNHYIISLSMKFSVVSKFTSFVAVEHRKKDEKFDEGRGPSIFELISVEDVDILDYITWEQQPVMEKNQEPAMKALYLSTSMGEEEKARQMSFKSKDSNWSEATEGSEIVDSSETDEAEEEPDIREMGRQDVDKEEIRFRALGGPSPPFISTYGDRVRVSRAKDTDTISELKPNLEKSLDSGVHARRADMDDEEEASEAPTPRRARRRRYLRKPFSAPEQEAEVNESKKTEKKEECYEPQIELSDDASSDEPETVSSAFQAPSHAQTKSAAHGITDAFLCRSGPDLPDKLQQPQEPLRKKAAPSAFGGGIARRGKISSGTDLLAEGFSCFGEEIIESSLQPQRNQLFGKPVKNGELFGNTQQTSLFSQPLQTAADPGGRPFSLHQKKKKAMEEIPTTTEIEEAPPIVRGGYGSDWQNMGMSRSAQASGGFMFGQSQLPQRNFLNYPQSNGLFGNSQQTKMFSQPLQAATDSHSPRLSKRASPPREEVLREVPATAIEEGAVPLNADSIVKQDTCPVPGDLHKPLPPPPAPPASHVPSHPPTPLPGGSNLPPVVPPRASFTKDILGVSKKLKGIKVASKQSASAATTAATAFKAFPPLPLRRMDCYSLRATRMAHRRSNEEEVQREQLDHTRERREKLKRIFTTQNSEGFWNVDDLPIIGIDTRAFTDLLASAGARSLGLKVFESVKRLLATVMMLAFIKLRLHVKCPLTLPFGRPGSEVTVTGLGEEYSEDITKALKWIKIQERKIPLLYSRLEFGVNWEAATQTMARKMKI